MPSPPVAFATCTHVFEAEILRGFLRSEGIEPRLRDAVIVTADWLMGVAVGGIEVGVPPGEADRARALLAAPADPFVDDETHTVAEVASWRALTGTLVSTSVGQGLLFSVYNVGHVVATADGETPCTWRRTLWAALFLLPWLGVLLAVGGAI